MEQERYWMWNKRKEGLNSHVILSNHRHNTYGDSWEEQAFAEDAAGPLGGCIWPPRSYTCSFCRREFRSAQALGGHMNVHRRDRARLKQSPAGHSSHEMLRHQALNPSQICHSMAANPNSDHCDHAFLASPSSISSKVSILPTPNINKKTFLPPLTSPFVQENLKSSISAPFSSWSKLEPESYFYIQGLDKEDKGSKVFESNCISKRNQITDDLSVNLNLMITQRHETTASGDKDEDVVVSCKRRRIDETLAFFPKRVSVDEDQPKSEVLDKLSPSSVESLDLELRLGDRPK